MALAFFGILIAIALGVLLFFWDSAVVSNTESGWSGYATSTVVAIDASPVSALPRYAPAAPTP
jgi:hypothetical protein